jgi:hypothetical protein
LDGRHRSGDHPQRVSARNRTRTAAIVGHGGSI